MDLEDVGWGRGRAETSCRIPCSFHTPKTNPDGEITTLTHCLAVALPRHYSVSTIYVSCLPKFGRVLWWTCGETAVDQTDSDRGLRSEGEHPKEHPLLE